MSHSPLLLDTLKGKKSTKIPLWLMRQAGRYLPEYRAIREKVSFLELCQNPALACEVTLQPIKRFGFDGAILFSDILVPLVPMGLHLSFGPDHGPQISNPVRKAYDVHRIRQADPQECGYVAEALKLIRGQLAPSITLLGFAGAPFTLASYMVEGGSSKNFSHIKQFMYTEPEAYHLLLQKITQTTIAYLKMQIEAGAQAVQLFDSWAGMLSPEDYRLYAHPYACQVLDAISPLAPIIHFAKQGGSFLPILSKTSAQAVGIGWEIDILEAGRIIPPNRTLQGNLDPGALFAPPALLKNKIQNILKFAANLPHPFVFNLGHGLLPQTPIDSVTLLIEQVRSFNPELV